MNQRKLIPTLALGALIVLLVGALLGVSSTPGVAAPGDSATTVIQKGVNYLTPDVVNWTKAGQTCAACHRQGAAVAGLATAAGSGYNVNQSNFTGLGYLAQILASAQEPSGIWSLSNDGIYQNTTSSYALFGLSQYDRFVNTRFSQNLVSGVEALLPHQQADGRWVEEFGAFPVNAGDAPVTARIMVAIAQAKERVDIGRARVYQAALDRAAKWIRDHKADEGVSNFELAYALVGLEAAGVPTGNSDLLFIRDRLLDRTSKLTGRGWGTLETDAADPFNTGVVLYALRQAGLELRSSAAVQQGVAYLIDEQINDPNTGGGYWESPLVGSRDIPTTFAILGLAGYGELGVRVSVVGSGQNILDANKTTPQTTSFTFDVLNTGAFGGTATFQFSAGGGLPGWTGTVTPASATLAAGQSTRITLNITTPAALPEALPVEWTVTATAQGTLAVSGSARVTTLTNPPPPAAGLQSITTLVSGPGAKVLLGQTAQVLSARIAAATGQPVAGPRSGVVTFFVAGVAVGADNDADGDGLFQVTWSPTLAWTARGTQDLRAIYSGIDQAGGEDLLGSVGAATLAVGLSFPRLEIVGVDPPSGNQGETLQVTINGNGFDEGAAVSFGEGVQVIELVPTALRRSRQVRALAQNRLVVVVQIDPGAALGSRAVTVTNPDGSTVTAPDAFLVTTAAEPLRFNGVEPGSAKQGETVQVTLLGDGFLPGAVVSFGEGVQVQSASVGKRGLKAASCGVKRIKALAETRLTVTLTVDPDAALGPRDVTVTLPDGRSATLNGAFEVLTSAIPLVLDGVSPNSGKQGESLRVTLSGGGFVPGAEVDFGEGITVQNPVVSKRSGKTGGVKPLADHVLTVDLIIAPTAPRGPRNVTVTLPDGRSETAVEAFTVKSAGSGKLSLPARKIDFGTVTVNKKKAKTFKITNKGVGPLTLSVETAAPFSVNQDNTIVLQKGKSISLTVTFAPKQKGKVVPSGELTIESDDPANEFVIVELAGSGK